MDKLSENINQAVNDAQISSRKNRDHFAKIEAVEMQEDSSLDKLK